MLSRILPLLCLGALGRAAAQDVASSTDAAPEAAVSESASTPTSSPGTHDTDVSSEPPAPSEPPARAAAPDPSEPAARATAPEAAAGSPPATDPVLELLRGFHFGSYGRVVGASDLRGGTGRSTRLVAFSPRVDEEDTYAELELRREDRFFGVDSRIVATVAYAGPLFHYDGEFAERIAIRNLFLDVSNVLTRGLGLWGGSRMVRGDDVYLLNLWPMDNLNLLGGGARYAFEDSIEFAVTGGSSQPSDPFQTQTVLVPPTSGFVPEAVRILDRPRTILSGRVTYWPFGRQAGDGLKLVAYGEQHWLASGVRVRDDGTRETLPEDSGYMLGAQLGGYVRGAHAFVNLFGRYARGLAAYDPLGVPFRTGTVVSTGRAEETRLAISANAEWRESPDIALGVQLGGYWRLFRDADPAVWNRGALSEGALSVRPHVWFGEVVGVALDLSVQSTQSLAFDDRTGDPVGGSSWKLAVLPFVSPWGRGTYSRPHLRVVYAVSTRDAGARALLALEDPRRAHDVEHFLGLSVEWWFNSSSYAP